MKLLIVESPNKIKKIKGYLGDGWNVAASVGHIRDLPTNEFGFEPPEFRPSYVINEDKKKVVSNLKKLASDASEVYLATDPDREGEAIAWHLKVVLGLKTYKRVTFDEITKSAIQKALNSPRSIDDHLVHAQEARRVADRIVGYLISPILSQQANIPMSAGRVQSPTVKLIVLREREIQAFTKKPFYSVKATLPNGLNVELVVKEWAADGKHIFDREIAEAIAAITQVKITSIETLPKEVKPRAPFTTSTLQQVASSLLKFPLAKTMELAQSLFESGFISYHRTDSPNLSAEAFTAFTEFAASQNMPARLQQLIFPAKEAAQEAHEAIRPTDISIESAGANDAERKLYNLIRERALASCLENAVDDVTTIEACSLEPINAGGRVSHAKLTAAGKIEKRAGWRSVCTIEGASSEDSFLPPGLKSQETYNASAKVVEKFTEPPQRFTEATLLKALEKLGIGRPSTYAQIVGNITKRQYIEIVKIKKEAKFVPTPLGFALIDALSCMTFMNLDYTRKLEEQLDEIAQGKGRYLTSIASVYDSVLNESKQIKTASQISTKPCPKCGQPLKQIHKQGKDPFWVHINESSECFKFIKDANGSPIIQEKASDNCPYCEKSITRRFSKQKDFHFWTHDNEDDEVSCRKFIKDAEGIPTKDG